MTLLCFLLDLRTISPALLHDLKQSLLQLANLYAVTRGRDDKDRCKDEIPMLRDLIGLCYIQNGRSPSSPPELKIAYRPGQSFGLHDFHHAVNNLPMNCNFPTEPMPTGSDSQEVSLTNLLNNKALYTWAGDGIAKKVIAVSTTVFTNSEAFRKSLMDAAEHCVTVEFVVLEQEDVNHNGASEKHSGFANSLHELENCVLRSYLFGRELGTSDLIETAVRVGEKTVLLLPSFDGSPKLRQISWPINFKVIERTSLATLNEGVILGTSYVVTPACHEVDAASDECDKPEMNTEIFHGLCGALFHLDQGLVCSSTCNTETMVDGDLHCFYLLQPSDCGPMLLRRLAGAEEILPNPDTGRLNGLVIPEEIKNPIIASLSRVELRDYNPLQHERGFHPKMNWLVKESLQLGSIPQTTEASLERHSPAHQVSNLQQLPSIPVPEEVRPNQNKDDSTLSCITEEWEQLLIVDEMNDDYSLASVSKPKIQDSTLTQNRPLDDKTSRILERLEAPKQLKERVPSPSVVISGQSKKPLLPFEPSSSQPMKPHFPKLKRKR